jgi:hypothetical protein
MGGRSIRLFRSKGAARRQVGAAFRSHLAAAPYSTASQHRAQVSRPGCNLTGSKQRRHFRSLLWFLTKAKNPRFVRVGFEVGIAEIVLVDGGHGLKVPSVSC